MSENNFTQNGAQKPPPDDRDFRAKEILVGETPAQFPEKFRLPKTPPQYQGASNHCTAYAVIKTFEIPNKVEHEMEIDFDPEKQWKNQKNYPGTATEKSGDYTRSALKSLRKFGADFSNQNFKIAGYATVENCVESFKNWISRGFAIFTSCDTTLPVENNPESWTTWLFAERTGFVNLTGARVGGHAFAIVGWDEEGFIGENSWGENWGIYGDGTFKIAFEDVPKMHESFVIYDSKDLKPNRIFADVAGDDWAAEEIRWCLEKGIFRGKKADRIPDPRDRVFAPNAPISRREMAIVLKRLHDFLKSGN